jgi:DNA-binding winged helix-turn-helix (wHTH) protein/TolB-like protein/tetratricopeptide (TPR) repeat protein
MSSLVKHLYQFGLCELDPCERLLFYDGRPVPLTPKAFDMLVILVERSGHLCEKEDLMKALWPDSFVEEGNLSVTVSLLRKALGDDRGHQRYIETVSKRGYRFVATVKCTGEQSAAGLSVEGSPDEQALGRPVRPSTLDISVPVIGKFRRAWVWRLAVLAVVVVVATLLIGRITRIKGGIARPPVGIPAIRTLAVLPFQTVGGENGEDNVGIAMADALITKLGNTGKIVTRPTSAVQKYAAEPHDSRTAGLEQGVDAVLDGRIQQDGDRVRLTVQLTRVRDGVQLWADAFDEKLTDIFTLEDEFSDRVARSICQRLIGEETGRFAKLSTKSSVAYQAYIRGRYFWNKRTEKAITRGLEYFQQAVVLDPTFAEAYAGVADSYAMLGLYGHLSPSESFTPAEDAAKRALDINGGLAEAHAALGFVYFYYHWNCRAAEKEFRRALDNDPNYAMAHSWNAENLAAMHRTPEAVIETELAQQIDPLSPVISTNAGLVFSLAGRYEHAMEALNKALEIEPNFPRAHFRLGNVYEQTGMPEKAILEIEQAVRLSRDDSYYEGALGHAYGIAGNVEQARKIVQLLRQRSRRQYVPAYAIALVYAGMQDKDEAFHWLEKAYIDHSGSMALLELDPALNNLHSDPRFQELVRRVDLDPHISLEQSTHYVRH